MMTRTVYRFFEYELSLFIACRTFSKSSKIPDTQCCDEASTTVTQHRPEREWKWECEMTSVSRLESEYDNFLFASVCETEEMTLSVLSVLARQDVDPWQEAARLAQLSRDQAVSSLASNIWKSNSERWSQSEASIVAVRLIEFLPSHSRDRSSSLWTDAGNGSLTFWIVAGLLFMSIAISGNSIQKTKDSSTSAHNVSMTMQKDGVARSSRWNGTD
jgi:hypothetical protein